MRVYHLGAECYPVAKVGGLADVVGALPKYQCQAGLQAAVVLPYYNRQFVREHQFDVVFVASTLLGHRRFDFEILKERDNALGFELYLIRAPGLLDRENVYSYPDETEQFIAYQLAFLDWINWSQQTPDIIHCHDHHAGLIPFLLYHSVIYKRLKHVPTVFTIHNGQYHGAFGWDKVGYLPEIDMTVGGLLDWNGGINPLAAAVKCCSKFTTVSPSYLEELKVQSNGLEHLFEMEEGRGVGVLNGIDSQVWDPANDAMIAAKFSAKKIDPGKAQNKLALCERFGLSPDKPLISFIGRLVTEKGADLLPEAVSRSLNELGDQLNILVLGTGDIYIQDELRHLLDAHPNVYNAYLGYDEKLSHLIYSGSDFLLMPSRVEPCGLNQLYALRYGTVPIVRSTGGLKDSVIDFEQPDGYGIRFEEASVDDICVAVKRAVELYQNTAQLELLRKRMMGLDFSWDQSAGQYIQLYQSLIPKL
ncbi:glycogen/starch synthase [Mucilaginibacter sp. RS28]|uniref:Glycogen synthase n=1 Tax=Mucilaginibacter straminoryzae TaxID=2932774 RepID=A0A9X2B7E9_9SPHI|nr:glycogen/starch synthase [Mucilaginibacter straminoryzae]MCJ8208246.1 glycogen/starch synthase [Mucilaginibacter straminoryzae]